ncbi:MAG: FtsQ-type POTRA domain-containing protein [Oscillospiraceae bacterium]|nr:FtsQ-type POTRA domain-containing protein [Oscillospiraceae bacterium]
MARQRRHSRPSRRRGRFSGLYKVLSILLIAGAVTVACVVFFRVNRVEVEGNVRYTAQEIIEASGIQVGDNLIALSRIRVSAAICTQLPYVENVSPQKVLPDKVVLRVTERVAAASVDSADGRWLISVQGKLLEKDNGTIEAIQITGLTAVAPYAGGMLQAGEGEQITLEYVKELLAVLESRRMLTQCTALDCSATTSMTLQYGIYRLKLPRGGDYDYYMRLAEGALAKGLEEGVLLEGQSGVLDLTVAEGKARFRADQ